jgi:hypothetical protein
VYSVGPFVSLDQRRIDAVEVIEVELTRSIRRAERTRRRTHNLHSPEPRIVEDYVGLCNGNTSDGRIVDEEIEYYLSLQTMLITERMRNVKHLR